MNSWAPCAVCHSSLSIQLDAIQVSRVTVGWRDAIRMDNGHANNMLTGWRHRINARGPFYKSFCRTFSCPIPRWVFLPFVSVQRICKCRPQPILISLSLLNSITQNVEVWFRLRRKVMKWYLSYPSFNPCSDSLSTIICFCIGDAWDLHQIPTGLTVWLSPPNRIDMGRRLYITISYFA